jgi:hypothetical protein
MAPGITQLILYVHISHSILQIEKNRSLNLRIFHFKLRTKQGLAVCAHVVTKRSVHWF